MPGIDHFGILAPYYERLIRLEEPAKMASMLGLPISGAVLDAGGGTGRVSQWFIGQASPVVVLDTSYGMLRQAAAKQGLEPVCSHTEKLPFPDGFFERIIMVDALHHVIDHGATTQELWRVLKSGGRLVIQEPDIRALAVKLVAWAEKLALMRSHFASPAEIKGMFSYANAKTSIECDRFIAWVIVEKI